MNVPCRLFITVIKYEAGVQEYIESARKEKNARFFIEIHAKMTEAKTDFVQLRYKLPYKFADHDTRQSQKKATMTATDSHIHITCTWFR